MNRKVVNYSQEARFLRALAHPVRLQIAEILSQEESCVCHLTARLGLRQAYISQQLGVLRSAGLLSERRVGTFIYHRLAQTEVRRFLEAMRQVTGTASPRLAPLDPSKCGCPRCELSREPVKP